MSSEEPTRIAVLKAKWLAFGRFMGNLIARIVLTIFYFLILAPFAIVARLLSDMLMLKPQAGELWQHRADTKSDIVSARQQG